MAASSLTALTELVPTRHPCTPGSQCAEFLRSQGVAVAADVAPLEQLRAARLLFVSCNGFAKGGPQLRCIESAHRLTQYGVPAACVGGGLWCEDQRFRTGVQLLKRLDAVIFIKTLPFRSEVLTGIHNRSAVILDMMDFDRKVHGIYACQRKWSSSVDHVLADHPDSWDANVQNCSEMAIKPVTFVEHFHSMHRRVSHGGQADPKTALLLQEHKESPPGSLCDPVQAALPQWNFSCITMATVDGRFNFLRSTLNINGSVLQSIISTPGGTGALFQKVFSRFDMLIVWRTTSNTVQRLSNALATGIPVVAQSCPAFERAFANYGVLLARGVDELRFWSHRLRESAAFRRQVSDAGVEAARQYSPHNISRQYVLAVQDSVSRRRQTIAAL